MFCCCFVCAKARRFIETASPRNKRDSRSISDRHRKNSSESTISGSRLRQMSNMDSFSYMTRCTHGETNPRPPFGFALSATRASFAAGSRLRSRSLLLTGSEWQEKSLCMYGKSNSTASLPTNFLIFFSSCETVLVGTVQSSTRRGNLKRREVPLKEMEGQ